MKRRLSIWLLETAEAFFLKAHGWSTVHGYIWTPPSDYPFRSHQPRTRGHAVNSLKQAVYNPVFSRR